MLIDDLISQADGAEKYLQNFENDPYCSWKEKEALLLGRPLDQKTSTAKSQIFDPRLSTIVFERSSRVMAQHATGKVQAIDTPKDAAKNMLMDLVLNKYVVPGADSQFDLLTKFRMEMVFSAVYGSYGHYIDWRMDDDYIGPDMWLFPIRHLMPEPNAMSVEESNFLFLDTWVTRQWLEDRPQGKDSNWKNINYILDELKKNDKSGAAKPSDKQSYSEQVYGDSSYGGKGKYAQIHLRRRFEKDHWVIYCPDFVQLKSRAIIQDVDNPHKNDEFPIVMKQTFPMLDRFWGLGEFERGKTLQYSINSLWNLYMDGVKMSIFPPMIYNPNGVVKSSLVYEPGARWMETTLNSIRQYQTSPQGTNTFMNVFGVLNSSLMNMAGTTDTTTSSSTDPTQGKTPQALQMIASREAARDNWERFMMEKSIEKTMNIFIDLIVANQDKPINLNLFEGEIKQIQQQFPDQAGELMDVFESGKFGKLKVTKSDLTAKYRFYIDAGTTMKKDQAAEHQTLTELLTLIIKVPSFLQQLQTTGTVQMGTTVFDFGEALKRWIISSGVEDWEKIVKQGQPGQPMPGQQLPGQMGNGIPPQGPGQVPPNSMQQPPIDLSQFANSDPQVQQLAQAIASSVGGQP